MAVNHQAVGMFPPTLLSLSECVSQKMSIKLSLYTPTVSFEGLIRQKQSD